jgi:hypothetical protein
MISDDSPPSTSSLHSLQCVPLKPFETLDLGLRVPACQHKEFEISNIKLMSVRSLGSNLSPSYQPLPLLCWASIRQAFSLFPARVLRNVVTRGAFDFRRTFSTIPYASDRCKHRPLVMIERLLEYSVCVDFLTAARTYPRSLGRGQF